MLAGYGGVIGVMLGAQMGGPVWMLGGFLVTLPLAFVFAAISDTRQSTTVAVSTTVFGARLDRHRARAPDPPPRPA